MFGILSCVSKNLRQVLDGVCQKAYPGKLDGCWFGWLGGVLTAAQCRAHTLPCVRERVWWPRPQPRRGSWFHPQSGGERPKASPQSWGSSWECVYLAVEGKEAPAHPPQSRSSSGDDRKLLTGAYGGHESREELNVLRQLLVKFSPLLLSCFHSHYTFT